MRREHGSISVGARVAVVISAACAFGCSDETATRTRYRGTLDVEVTRTAHVSVETSAADDKAATVTLSFVDDGHGVAAPGSILSAVGRIESFPEAEMSLLAVRFGLPPRADGPCGDRPIGLALSLVRRGDAERVAGGLTVYCSAERFPGPPARVLRISGTLPKGR